MEAKESRYILSNVVPNTDHYTWKELNCMYKPFSIAINSIEDGFGEMFLILLSRHLIYEIGTDRLLYNRHHMLFDYFEHELKAIFSTSIKIEEASDNVELITKMEQEIRHGNVVICPTDLYELPYCDTYMERHQRHFTIIKGYDSYKQIFYILDTTHIELATSTIYKDFMLEYDRICKLAKSFADNYDDSHKMYFWSLHKEENKEYDPKKAFVKGSSYLTVNNQKLLEQKEYQYHCIELEISEEMKKEVFRDDIAADVRLMNLRKVYYESLVSFLNRIHFSNMDRVREECDKLKDSWDKIKKVLVFKHQRKDSNVAMLQEEIMKTIERDKQFIKFINDQSSSQEQLEESGKFRYSIVNNKNAKLEYDNTHIVMELNEDTIYDTWRAKDDACQVLFPTQDKKAIEFGISVKVKEDFFSCVHTGIVVVWKDGTKILFGGMEGYRVGIYAPQEVEQSELYLEEYDISKEYYLSLKESQDTYEFYFDNGKKKKVYEMQKQKEIGYVGVFAKTWEKYKCRVEFRNITFIGVRSN